MAITNKANFTKDYLNTLTTPPQGKRAYYYDTKTQGLGICVTSANKKTFVVYRKIEGRPERIKLEQYPGMSIEQARGRTSEINASIARGDNPAQIRRAKKEELTLHELFENYLKLHAKKHKSSWKEDVRQFDCYLSHWKQRKLSLIKKIDIHKLHQEIGNASGYYAANRLLALLSCVFNQANKLGLWDKLNPAIGIKKFKENSRSRFLQADELPRFFSALAEEPNEHARDYILLSLLTGARKSNVLAMRWEELNLEIGLWNIAKTKNGDAHTIPLVAQAVEILKTKYLTKQSDWVFPSHGKSGHLADPKKPWQRILQSAGIKDLRIHDLRRSLGSWQASTGASLVIIGKTLSHRNVNTTAIYARLNIDPVRDAMNKATQAIWDAGNCAPPDSNQNISNINQTMLNKVKSWQKA
ncbi:MAG: tyrosine-type recombinase/integrase [Gammaproteobacteria bacterium]